MDEVNYYRVHLPVVHGDALELPMNNGNYRTEARKILVPDGYQIFQVLEADLTSALVILVS